MTTRRTRRTCVPFFAPAPRRASRRGSAETAADAPSRRFAVTTASQASSMVKGRIGASQVDQAIEQLVDHGRARLAPHARDRVAIERILADVEIEGRKLDGHEIDQRARDALEVEGVVAGAHDLASSSASRCSISRSSSGMSDCAQPLAVVMRQRAEHPADGVAELAIGIDVGLEDLGADPLGPRHSRSTPPRAAGYRRRTA